MKETIFGNVAVGQTFFVNDKEYTKLQTRKITCCKSINCQETSNASNRAYFKDSTVVKVKEGNG